VDVDDKDQELNNQDPVGDTKTKKKKSMGFLTKILMVVGVLVIQIAVAYFGINAIFFGDSTSGVNKSVEESKCSEVGPIIELEELIVNPSGSKGRRFLVVKVALELLNIKVQAELDKQMPMINDGLIKLLASKNVEYLSNIAARDSLREEMRLTINDRLPSGKGITNLYFTGFVLQ